MTPKTPKTTKPGKGGEPGPEKPPKLELQGGKLYIWGPDILNMTEDELQALIDQLIEQDRDEKEGTQDDQ